MTNLHMSQVQIGNVPVSEPVAPVPVSEPAGQPVEPTRS
jgi:hypothetical protein